MKRYVLIFLFVVATGFVLKAVWKTGWDMGRQYEGVCLETGKRLTDEEKIRAMILRINSSPTASVNLVYYKRVPSPSVDKFLEENPGCCRLDEYNGDTRGFDKAIGAYAGHVTVNYTLHYLDKNGVERQTPASVTGTIQNCGVVN